MRYHDKDSGRRIQSNVSQPTTPDTWKTMTVVAKFMSAADATAWQSTAVRNTNMLGLECSKGLVPPPEPWYLIPIEPNSMVITIKYVLYMASVEEKEKILIVLIKALIILNHINPKNFDFIFYLCRVPNI